MNLAFALWVYPRLDRPQPATITRKIEHAGQNNQGRRHSYETVPLFDPEGHPVIVTPSSSLFFIPVRYLWVVLVVVAVGPRGWVHHELTGLTTRSVPRRRVRTPSVEYG